MKKEDKENLYYTLNRILETIKEGSITTAKKELEDLMNDVYYNY